MSKSIRRASSESNAFLADDPSSIFSTYDLGVSAALLCLGFEIISIDKENPRKALFIFKKENGIEKAANEYFADNLKIKGRSYFDHLKALKNRLYSD